MPFFHFLKHFQKFKLLHTAPTQGEYQEIENQLRQMEGGSEIIEYLSKVELDWQRFKWNKHGRINGQSIPHMVNQC